MNLILNDFLEYLREKKYTKSTLNSYYFAIKDFFNFLVSNNLSNTKFNNNNIQHFINEISKKNTPQTINSKIFAIKKYIAYLRENKNIVIDFDINPIKMNTKKTITPIGDINKLINYIEKANKNELIKNRDKLIIKLLYYVGAKTNDIIKLKKKHFRKNILNFGDKQIIISDETGRDIKNYLEIINIKDDEYIFFNFSPAQSKIKSNKKHLTQKSVQDIFNKYKKVISNDLSIRDLRNSLLANNKNNPLNINLTKIYFINTINYGGDYLQYLREKNNFI